MVHARSCFIDADASSGTGFVNVPPCRLAAVEYRVPDDVTFDATVVCDGATLFTKSGASNVDGLQQVDGNPAITGELELQAASIFGGSEGAQIVVTFLVDFGGDG
ncbi:MAG TPA: hypothetical protein VFB25_10810 [Gaiellaceae bacterium]|nr:hypothetical protein [Gaiellaceae bacterium]